MKLRRIFAAIAACAVAATMAISAYAGEVPIANENTGDGKVVADVVDLPEGKTFADIYGVAFTFENYDAEKGVGGGICYQSTSVSWTMKEYGNEGSNKPYVVDAEKLSVTMLLEEPLFAADDEYAQVFISEWDGWGLPITVKTIDVLAKDGSVLKSYEIPAAEEETKDPGKEESKDESKDESKNESKDESKDDGNKADADDSNKPTGATAGLALAGLAIAGAAVVAAKKSK